MKRTITPALLVALVLVTGLVGYGCSTLQGIGAALGSLKKMQFQLGDVNGLRLNGIDVSRINRVSDVGPMDMVRLGHAIASKSLPMEFTLNVLAKNPNDGASGTKATPLYLSRLDWRMKIDGRETVSGVVNKKLEIPGSGQTTTIPLTVQMDLFKFFGDKGVDDLVNLAVALGGSKGSSSRIELLAKVQVDVPGIGPINYPGEISIVDKQFSNP
ncbi:MAG: LEA type 2 family protein [bacterium]|nr:LEA type 2 family protein [Candidatus Kapabacteria bacterium]